MNKLIIYMAVLLPLAGCGLSSDWKQSPSVTKAVLYSMNIDGIQEQMQKSGIVSIVQDCGWFTCDQIITTDRGQDFKEKTDYVSRSSRYKVEITNGAVSFWIKELPEFEAVNKFDYAEYFKRDMQLAIDYFNAQKSKRKQNLEMWN